MTIASSVIAYKMIAATSSLVVIWAVWGAARLRGLNPVKAVAIVGLNPVIVVYGVGGGYNDLLMLALLISGLYLLLQEKERASGALIVTAVAVKLTAGLVLPFALARGARKRPTDAGRRALLVGVGTAAGIVAFLTFVVFGTGPLRLLRTLHDVQSRGACTASPGCC